MKSIKIDSKIIINRKNFTLCVNKKYDNDNLRCFLSDVEYNLNNARILKEQRTVKAALCNFSDKVLFIKKYNDRGLLYRLKYLFRKTRALNAMISWDYINEYAPEAITPEHIAALWNKNLTNSISYLITTAVEQQLDTMEMIKTYCKTDEGKIKIITAIVANLAKLHNAKIAHCDAKLSNFYFCGTIENYKCGLWDLDNCRTFHNTGTKLRERDLARAIASFAEYSQKVNMIFELKNLSKIFSEIYKQLSGIDISPRRLQQQAIYHIK